MNQFLNHLPKTVIKNGQVIDIRQNIEQQLTVSGNQIFDNSILYFSRVNKKQQHVVIGIL